MDSTASGTSVHVATLCRCTSVSVSVTVSVHVCVGVCVSPGEHTWQSSQVKSSQVKSSQVRSLIALYGNTLLRKSSQVKSSEISDCTVW